MKSAGFRSGAIQNGFEGKARRAAIAALRPALLRQIKISE